MELRTKISLSEDVYALYNAFCQKGFQLYLVGGAVRDHLLNLTNKKSDLDFSTNAHPQDVSKLFKTVIPTGIQHGTVTVVLNKTPYEITTYRTESAYENHRKPKEVRFSNCLTEDLKRRDFTVNAFAYDLKKEIVIDLFDGYGDLKTKTLRAIGNPLERLQEDALRMMRACRFIASLGFNMDEKLLNAITTKSELITKISIERIRDEFVKTITAPGVFKGIELLNKTKLLNHFLPELVTTCGVRQNKYHEFDVYYHLLHTVSATKSTDYKLRLASLLHDIGKPKCKYIPKNKSEADCTFYNHEIVGAKMTHSILKRLSFSNADIAFISHLVKHHMFHYTDEWTDGAVRRFIKNVGEENLPHLFELRAADRIGNGQREPTCREIENFKKRIQIILKEEAAFKIKDLKIDGNILIKRLKLKPSPIIGNVLKHLLEFVLDDPKLNQTKTLLKEAKKYLQATQKTSSV